MAKQKFWNGTAWEVVGSDAEKIAIKDTGNLFTATDVESALVEIENNRRTHMAEYASVFKLKSIISRRGTLGQSIPNDTNTAILFNVARRTDDSLITYDATTGEFTIVSPDIKLIRVTVLATWVPNANGYRLVGINYNGNIYNPESPGVQILPASVGGAYDSKEPLQQISALILPTVGYKFTATVRHNAGTAINLSNRNVISMEVYV